MVTKNQRIAGSRKSVCEASSYQTQNTGRRSPRGERGLKFRQENRFGRDFGRSPRGERGLKY